MLHFLECVKWQKRQDYFYKKGMHKSTWNEQSTLWDVKIGQIKKHGDIILRDIKTYVNTYVSTKMKTMKNTHLLC